VIIPREALPVVHAGSQRNPARSRTRWPRLRTVRKCAGFSPENRLHQFKHSAWHSEDAVNETSTHGAMSVANIVLAPLTAQLDATEEIDH
jgi:hypothetical protein